jgi:hypothetical protein
MLIRSLTGPEFRDIYILESANPGIFGPEPPFDCILPVPRRQEKPITDS